MADPLNLIGATQPGVMPTKTPGAAKPTGEVDFKELLLEKLDEVKQLQDEAGDGVKALISGETKDVGQVLSAVKKADVAFSLLMEIRNKMMDAYDQIQQMRV